MKKVDMSSEAITRRLKTVDQLRELCLSLMKAKKESDEEAALEKKTTMKTTGDTEKPILRKFD
jgi:hypothetical protein